MVLKSIKERFGYYDPTYALVSIDNHTSRKSKSQVGDVDLLGHSIVISLKNDRCIRLRLED